jgi:uncharacterized membrane protein SpoIIM required for sporulation
MKQQQFVTLHQSLWATFIAKLDVVDKLKIADGAQTHNEAQERIALIEHYHQVCQHLAIARTRGYSPLLIEQLQKLVVRAHNRIYQVKTSGGFWRFLRFFSHTFPRAVRREWRAVALAAVLFWGVGIVMALACYFNPEMIYTIMDYKQVAHMEWMYDPANPVLGRDKENFDQSRFQMFGFYVWNNTSIGLRVFASGILLGIGTIVQLLLNALSIGAVAGHLTQLGYVSTFWSFVSGHAAFELGAITLSGAAGLLLAKGIWRASLMQRLDYLKSQAMAALPIIAGAALMFILAAMIEGFWSPQPAVSPVVKYVVGAFLMVLTLLYFVYAGRGEPNVKDDDAA